MGFEEVKAGIDMTLGVIETLYHFGQMTESMRHCYLASEKTKLMRQENELLRERLRLKNQAYLNERKKVASEFERIQEQFKEDLEKEMNKQPEKKQVEVVKTKRRFRFAW